MIKILRYISNPLTVIGEASGKCYGTTNIKAFERIAKQCLAENHGRTQEFAGITLEFSGYSAKVIRELFRHKHMSELQASTRYIDYTKQFDYIIPPSIENNKQAKDIWQKHMGNVAKAMQELKEIGMPIEDFSNVLPLSYETNGVMKLEVRELIHMFGVRSCTCAYHEARKFMADLKEAIMNLNDEQWTFIAENYFVPKCDRLLYCEEEKRCCGRHLKKSVVKQLINDYIANNK